MLVCSPLNLPIKNDNNTISNGKSANPNKYKVFLRKGSFAMVINNKANKIKNRGVFNPSILLDGSIINVKTNKLTKNNIRFLMFKLRVSNNSNEVKCFMLK